ncbi:MAG: DUF4258 domain-containing protein [Ruminococcus flavefaciens]|nr:DUF4258 domain-containing protein [Ruminococcus flavefaciens]
MKIDILRKLIQENKIRWSTHCVERMGERDISRADVKNCINNGEIIEDYPSDFPYPSCLIFGCTIRDKILHIVAGSDEQWIYIITAYYPSSERFEDDMRTRRVK